MSDRLVTAVVVNYNSGNHLEDCLGALLRDDRLLAGVLVVDNASTDASAEIAQSMGTTEPRIELVRSEVNLGLAGGVNLVLGEVDTPYVAILNPDVTPRDSWLESLVGFLEEDPSVGAVCPLIVIAGTNRINSAGQHIHVTGLGFNRLLDEPVGNAATDWVDVDGIHGAAFVVRRDVLEELGGWDETGFLYQEDVALSWDILLSGRRIVLVPEAQVSHDYHLTMYPEKLYLLERNRWALLLSHLRTRRLLGLTFAILFSELLVWGLALVRGPRFISAKWKSYVWVLSHLPAIRAWRGRVFSRSTYDEAILTSHTHWSYPWRQLLGLGAERGESSRIPPGGLPV